jgi:hypothetical protein
MRFRRHRRRFGRHSFRRGGRRRMSMRHHSRRRRSHGARRLRIGFRM